MAKRILIYLLVLTMAICFCGSGVLADGIAETDTNMIIDVESGETADELMDDTVPVWASLDEGAETSAAAIEVGGKSAILMEVSSGQVLFEKNPHEKMPIASVTKVMTLLLVMEAIERGQIAWNNKVTCSDFAASLGGSQIWLEEGEVMTVSDLVKAIAVVSANDACAMIAEHISGSELAFVGEMNKRAAELGMKNTKFTDTCGLDEAAYSSAHDVALMSRALIAHEKITEYTTIWMDTLRDGKSQLVNTNKLIRFYQGATGLKTGTTSQAGHCLSATAQRDGMSLVSVILGCSTTDERFGGARKMLDYGFASHSIYTPEIKTSDIQPVKVLRGTDRQVDVYMDAPTPVLIKKGQESNITQTIEMAENVQAPVEEQQILGKLTLKLDDTVLAEYDIVAIKAVKKMGFGTALSRLLAALIT